MSTAEVIEQALSLKASDRYLLLELLHTSLDKPDPEIGGTLMNFATL